MQSGTPYIDMVVISVYGQAFIPNTYVVCQQVKQHMQGNTNVTKKGPESEMAADQGDEHVLYTCTYESAEPLLTPVFFTLVIL